MQPDQPPHRPPPCTTIGIVAHVDAGKTSLTERLLFHTGVTDHLGTVDAGDTVTDTGEIERRRGITIRTGVAAFALGDLRVMLVDTPGHAEFVAEVERALAVLDAAILVVSAVEGIQSHTRLLMRTLRGLGIPVALFVNKLDRQGARTSDLVDDIRTRLTAGVLPVNAAAAAGTSGATTTSLAGTARLREDTLQLLAMHNDRLLRRLVDDEPAPSHHALRRLLREQIRTGLIQPLVFGSARTGVGVDDLLAVVADLLPRANRNAAGPLAGRVFAFDRSGGSGRHARPLVRVDAGCLHVRDHVNVLHQRPDADSADRAGSADGGDAQYTRMRITEVGVIGGGQVAYAGDIAVITGLGAVAVGDRIDGDGTAACKGTTDRASLGTGTTKSADSVRLPARLPRPDLSTIVTATDPTDTSALFHALTEMAAQDPLINADFIGSGRARVLLFGEVQQQVLRDTLADEYGVATQFSPAELRHLERPIGTGSAMRNGFRIGIQALVGFRVQPAPRGAGLRYRLEVELGALPTSFHDAIRQTVQRSLQQGLFGWPMTDVCVTVTETAYSSVSSTAGDFRRLTPLPLFEALARAGTGVYEPSHRFDVEVPPDCVGPVLSALTRHEAEIEQSAPLGPGWQIRGQLPLRHIHAVRQALPGLTRGEAAWTAVPGDDRAVTGPAPTAERTDGNPLDEQAYLRHVRGW